MSATWTATLWFDDIATVDHPATGLARLIWQYRVDQPRIQAFLRILLDQLQLIEDVTYDVLVGIWPLTAVGAQLDTLGEIVMQDRGPLADEEYRLFILGRIFVNHMDGRRPEFYDLLEILGVTEQIYADETPPAYLRIDCTKCSYGKLIGELVRDGKPGGVDLLWVYNDELEEDSFAFSSTPGSDEVDVSGGFANVAGTTGGKFSGSSVR
jgi:hypothetical protein